MSWAALPVSSAVPGSPAKSVVSISSAKGVYWTVGQSGDNATVRAGDPADRHHPIPVPIENSFDICYSEEGRAQTCSIPNLLMKTVALNGQAADRRVPSKSSHGTVMNQSFARGRVVRDAHPGAVSERH